MGTSWTSSADPEALEQALGPRRDSNYILVPFGANQVQAQEVV